MKRFSNFHQTCLDDENETIRCANVKKFLLNNQVDFMINFIFTKNKN